MVPMIQILEITIRHSAKIAECCDKISQRGTLARMTEARQVTDIAFVCIIAILAILAVVLIGSLVWLACHERKQARVMVDSAMATPYYRDLIPFTSLFDFASLNVVSQPKTVKGKL